MELLVKIVGTLVLTLILVFGGVHLFEYANHGGLRGGISSNLIILSAFLVGMAVVIGCIIQIWKKK